MPKPRHKPVETLAELLALNQDELRTGWLDTERGDPEPGANHSRAYHHGWRVRMMNLGEIEITPAHRRLTREYVNHMREARNA